MSKRIGMDSGGIAEHYRSLCGVCGVVSVGAYAFHDEFTVRSLSFYPPPAAERYYVLG